MSNHRGFSPALAHRPRRRIHSPVLLLIAALLVSGNGSAFGRIVHDPIQTARHIAEFRQQVARWNQTLDQYRRQLISLGGMSVTPTALQNANAAFPTVDQDYGLEDACRATRGDGLMGSIRGLFRPDPNRDVLEQQLDICRRIVRAENLKYNETVKYLNNLRDRQRELGRIDQRRRAVGNEPGKLQAVNYDIDRMQQTSKMDIDNWQAMMTAYDSYIAQLNKYQQRLAQKALRGTQPDILTTVVQGAVLQQALRRRLERDNP
jgi:hypothetical protein